MTNSENKTGEEAFDFENLTKDHIKMVYNFTLRLSGSESDANDITQEVFIKVWKNFKKIDRSKNIKTWILTIARNTTIDWMRKRKNVAFSKLDQAGEESDKKFEETLPDTEPLPDEIFQRKELAKDLDNVLQKIRPDFKEVILLHYVNGLTFKEISEMLNKPLSTVKSQHRRALHNLRKLLQESAPKL